MALRPTQWLGDDYNTSGGNSVRIANRLCDTHAG